MILSANDLTDAIRSVMSEENVFVLTDENVARLYAPLFENVKKYVIKPGEDSKTLDSIKAIAGAMLKNGMNRKSKLVAAGGGVVGDIGGFTAAVFMRGIEWVSVPTTLLAQVDSGIGGKTGVDLDDYKNILGAFHQPSDILISGHFLQTLPERERLCGIGEIVKTSFLHAPLFELLSSKLNKLIAFEPEAVGECVKMCAAFKEDIVAQDEKETSGLRKILNLGHTVGHAIEKADKHVLSHGEYVLWGLLIEGFITKKFVNAQVGMYSENIVKRVLKGRTLKFDVNEVADAALSDKKNENGRISIIAVIDKGSTRELFFSKKEIITGLEGAKKEFGII